MWRQAQPAGSNAGQHVLVFARAPHEPVAAGDAGVKFNQQAAAGQHVLVLAAAGSCWSWSWMCRQVQPAGSSTGQHVRVLAAA
jgi:uncharacterized protein YfiM (DUF2279 family)